MLLLCVACCVLASTAVVGGSAARFHIAAEGAGMMNDPNGRHCCD